MGERIWIIQVQVRRDTADHVGRDASGLYTNSQVMEVAQVLTHNVYGNSHSCNPTRLVMVMVSFDDLAFAPLKLLMKPSLHY